MLKQGFQKIVEFVLHKHLGTVQRTPPKTTRMAPGKINKFQGKCKKLNKKINNPVRKKFQSRKNINLKPGELKSKPVTKNHKKKGNPTIGSRKIFNKNRVIGSIK
jgi:hypothetical protein